MLIHLTLSINCLFNCYTTSWIKWWSGSQTRLLRDYVCLPYRDTAKSESKALAHWGKCFDHPRFPPQSLSYGASRTDPNSANWGIQSWCRSPSPPLRNWPTTFLFMLCLHQIKTSTRNWSLVVLLETVILPLTEASTQNLATGNSLCWHHVDKHTPVVVESEFVR